MEAARLRPAMSQALPAHTPVQAVTPAPEAFWLTASSWCEFGVEVACTALAEAWLLKTAGAGA
ncbi:hypothetical protein D3C73_1313460 [compost metagenome]